ncbi:hypothetical protein ACJMK2_021960 [Sinanodonta woodiana]|uniref:Uncharacterized protein n=1 Tax=Sinanodonta woodiana TaxID=1069815 RepID=A0ABD3TIT3_SINWO
MTNTQMLVMAYNSSFDEEMCEEDYDKIEVLSSQIEEPEEFLLTPVSQLDTEELEQRVQKEKGRKRIVRVIVIVSLILLLFSVVLVALSLYMSKDIDKSVRNSNEMLRRHNDRMSQGTQLREQHTLPATVNVTLQH